MDISVTVIALRTSYNFTGLTDDTLFNVIVIGTSINEKNVIDVAFTSVRTMESMYVCMCKCIFINYMYITYHTVFVKLLMSQIFDNSFKNTISV